MTGPMEDYRVTLARQALTEAGAVDFATVTAEDLAYWVTRMKINLTNLVDLADQDETTARRMSVVFEEAARSRDLNVIVAQAAFHAGIEHERKHYDG